MNNGVMLNEKEVTEVVVKYFNEDGFTVEEQRNIQFGTKHGGTVDVVVKNSTGYWVAIVECKDRHIGKTKEGVDQLKSYLSATDSRFGILAFSGKTQEWIYYENLRCNVIPERSQGYFNKHKSEPPTEDRKTQHTLNQTKRYLKHRTIALIAAVAILVATPIGLFIFQVTQKETNYEVRRIIDGDTVEIQYEGKATSVQLIGVNAPETGHLDKPIEPYGEEATHFMRELLLDESVYIRFEEHERDQYDRLLGYVYRTSDDMFINLEIIREGYGRVDTRHQPFKHEELFMAYQSRAKDIRKGLWKVITDNN